MNVCDYNNLLELILVTSTSGPTRIPTRSVGSQNSGRKDWVSLQYYTGSIQAQGISREVISGTVFMKYHSINNSWFMDLTERCYDQS